MAKDDFFRDLDSWGILSQNDIRLLLCYLLKSIGGPVHRDVIVSAAAQQGIANYYELRNTLESLISLENITAEEDVLSLTEKGLAALETLEVTLSPALRERTVSMALSLLRRNRIQEENKVSIEQTGRGYLVHCSIEDQGGPLFSLSLFVADRMQADLVKERFLSRPEELYTTNLELLAGN